MSDQLLKIANRGRELEMRLIPVVGAVIVDGGMVLCAKRGTGGNLAGSWEFPGGKVEPNEEPIAALVREIDEELQCQIMVGDPIVTTRHEYSFATIVLSTFYCELVSGQPQPTEHAEVRWCAPNEMSSLAWAPADVPAVERVIRDLG